MARSSTLPRTGSDADVLAAHLTKFAVWQVLLLHGTFHDDFTDAEISRRLKRVGADVPADQVMDLYRLAVKRAAADTAKK